MGNQALPQKWPYPISKHFLCKAGKTNKRFLILLFSCHFFFQCRPRDNGLAIFIIFLCFVRMKKKKVNDFQLEAWLWGVHCFSSRGVLNDVKFLLSAEQPLQVKSNFLCKKCHQFHSEMQIFRILIQKRKKNLDISSYTPRPSPCSIRICRGSTWSVCSSVLL